MWTTKKKIVLIGILVILISGFLSGCTDQGNTQNTEKDKFVGTWYKSNYLVLDLHLDGTCSYLGETGTWDITEDILTLMLSSGYTPTFTYAFSDSNLTLKLTSTLDDSTTVYTKRGET